MIQRSLVELELNGVTAYFDIPSGVPVFSSLDAGGLYVKKFFIYCKFIFIDFQYIIHQSKLWF
jgi:hypothetical protein